MTNENKVASGCPCTRASDVMPVDAIAGVVEQVMLSMESAVIRLPGLQYDALFDKVLEWIAQLRAALEQGELAPEPEGGELADIVTALADAMRDGAEIVVNHDVRRMVDGWTEIVDDIAVRLRSIPRRSAEVAEVIERLRAISWGEDDGARMHLTAKACRAIADRLAGCAPGESGTGKLAGSAGKSRPPSGLDPNGPCWLVGFDGQCMRGPKKVDDSPPAEMRWDALESAQRLEDLFVGYYRRDEGMGSHKIAAGMFGDWAVEMRAIKTALERVRPHRDEGNSDGELITLIAVVDDLESLKHWAFTDVPNSDCECFKSSSGRHEGCTYIQGMVARRGGSFVRRKELYRVIRKLRAIIDAHPVGHAAIMPDRVCERCADLVKCARGYD